MKADKRFQNLPLEFWSNVRLISQRVGYARKGIFIVPTHEQIKQVYSDRGLNTSKVITEEGIFTDYGNMLESYFIYRRDVLTNEVRTNLMNKNQAKAEFDKIQEKYKDSKAPIPRNKQKGDKSDVAFLTGIVNLLL